MCLLNGVVIRFTFVIFIYVSIDAIEEKQLGAFVNDSRLGNCTMKKISVTGKGIRQCLFATEDIPSGIEIRYNYNDTNMWWRTKVCAIAYVVICKESSLLLIFFNQFSKQNLYHIHSYSIIFCIQEKVAFPYLQSSPMKLLVFIEANTTANSQRSFMNFVHMLFFSFFYLLFSLERLCLLVNSSYFLGFFKEALTV